jgi:hypothetical protein
MTYATQKRLRGRQRLCKLGKLGVEKVEIFTVGFTKKQLRTGIRSCMSYGDVATSNLTG